MKIYKSDIVLQEIPGEISLGFYVCGCPIKCPGCHSPELWSEKNGTDLTFEAYDRLLNRYKGYISNVLFFGGEWRETDLVCFLEKARQSGLKTSLYTGLEDVSPALRSALDFLKVGPWRADLGGLWSPTTNQILWNLRTGQNLNFLFQNKTHNTEVPHVYEAHR